MSSTTFMTFFTIRDILKNVGSWCMLKKRKMLLHNLLYIPFSIKLLMCFHSRSLWLLFCMRSHVWDVLFSLKSSPCILDYMSFLAVSRWSGGCPITNRIMYANLFHSLSVFWAPHVYQAIVFPFLGNTKTRGNSD